MKKTTEKTIKVGDYEVARRGSRIVVLNPAYTDEEYNCDTGEYKDVLQPATVEVALSMTQARQALALSDAESEIEEIEAQIDKLQDQIDDLETGIDIKGYSVSSDGDGISFGCTDVNAKTLAEIKKLLK